MDSQPLTQLSQTSAESQMRVLEMVLQIILVTTLVLFATTLVIIVWLCLRELSQPQPGGPGSQKVSEKEAEVPLSIDSHTHDSVTYSLAGAFSPWHATWARRMFSRLR
jgi:hypothetical protein